MIVEIACLIIMAAIDQTMSVLRRQYLQYGAGLNHSFCAWPGASV